MLNPFGQPDSRSKLGLERLVEDGGQKGVEFGGGLGLKCFQRIDHCLRVGEIGGTPLIHVRSQQEPKKRTSVSKNQVARLFRLVQGY